MNKVNFYLKMRIKISKYTHTLVKFTNNLKSAYSGNEELYTSFNNMEFKWLRFFDAGSCQNSRFTTLPILYLIVLFILLYFVHEVRWEIGL